MTRRDWWLRAFLLLPILVIACGGTTPAGPSVVASPPGSTPPLAQICPVTESTDTRLGGFGTTTVGATATRVYGLFAFAPPIKDVAPADGPWAIELNAAPNGETLRVDLFQSPQPAATVLPTDPAQPVFLSTTVTTPLPQQGAMGPAPILCWTGHVGDSYLIRLQLVQPPAGHVAQVTLIVRQPR